MSNMSRAIIASIVSLMGLPGVLGGGPTDHTKHDDWKYGASDADCSVVDDAKRCGPSDWSTVAGDEACAQLGTQSPIDLTSPVTKTELTALVLTSGTFAKVEFERNSHTTEVGFTSATSSDNKMKVTWSSVDYFLTQFHFHSPSENTIDGNYYPMEVHHVHQSSTGQALVLSVMIDSKATAENAYYKKIWDGIGTVADGESTEVVWELEGALSESPYTAVLPSNKDYFYYKGSFTTPPCTIDTIWIVLKTSISITTAQLEAYRLKIQGAPSTQLAACDVSRCGAATPTGVALQMASGTTWDEAQGTNNRPIQVLTGTNSPDRKVYHFVAAADDTVTTTAVIDTPSASSSVRAATESVMCMAVLVAFVLAK